jgi:AcrR family transcriptional regulator
MGQGVPAVSAADQRQRRLLEAALATFARYGFRKTSMEEIARAANLSRQSLYSHFSTKEDLFRATVQHALETALIRVSEKLGDVTASLAERLEAAFDEWVGRWVGTFGADVTDIQEAATALLGTLVQDSDERFADMVTKALRASGLPAHYKSAGITARQLTDTLRATARGLKHTCTSRAEFRVRIAVAAKALCLPLAERK